MKVPVPAQAPRDRASQPGGAGPAAPHPPSGAAQGRAPGGRRAVALLWLGQVISHLGDSLFFVGIFFLALDVTGSKAGSGLLVATNFLPALLLGLFAGAFVDRHDRRRIMIAADLLRAAAVAAIPILASTGHLSAWALGAATFLLASGTTLFNPAIKALIPEIVSGARLTTTVAVFQLSEFAALVAGPILAEVIVRRLGALHLFSVDAATFVFSAVALALVPAAAAGARGTSAAPRPALVREVLVGLRAVLARPPLRTLLLVVALDNLMVMGLAQVATPLLVKETLGLGVDAYARAQRAYFLGLVVASAGFWALGRRAPKGPTILLGLVLDAVTFVPLAFCETLGQVQVALFVHALPVPLIVIPRTVLIQERVAGPLHGRAFSLVNVTVFGMMALSAALVGRLAEAWPPETLFLALGTLGALPGLAALGLSSMRRVR